MLSISLNRPAVQLIGYKFHKLSKLLDRQIDSFLIQQFDLTLSQFVLLFGLAHYPQTSQSEVAKYLNLTQAAVSRQIDHLIEKDLVERQANAQNRREHILKITPAGLATLAEAKTGVGEMYQQVFLGISRRQINNFNKVLDRVLKNAGRQQT